MYLIISVLYLNDGIHVFQKIDELSMTTIVRQLLSIVPLILIQETIQCCLVTIHVI